MNKSLTTEGTPSPRKQEEVLRLTESQSYENSNSISTARTRLAALYTPARVGEGSALFPLLWVRGEGCRLENAATLTFGLKLDNGLCCQPHFTDAKAEDQRGR